MPSLPSATPHPSRHVWDFWYYFDAQARLFHLFYLNADPALVATQQHHYATWVGHATTTDFVTIDWGGPDRFNVLQPPAHHWANTCLWSGDVVRVRDRYLMFYTSRDRRQDDGFTQSIGVAHTTDLNAPQWQFFDTQIQPQASYQLRGLAGDRTLHAWRDPFLFRDRDRRQISMLVAAKAIGGPLGQSGAIAQVQIAEDHFAQAVRGDRAWDYLTPLAAPGCYAEMEVPQLYRADSDIPLLIFSTWARYDFSPATGGVGGLQGIPLGPGWPDRTPSEPSAGAVRVMLPEHQGLYACRVVPELGGEIIGFDTHRGGIRRSGIQTGWGAMDRDFSDLEV